MDVGFTLQVGVLRRDIEERIGLDAEFGHDLQNAVKTRPDGDFIETQGLAGFVQQHAYPHFLGRGAKRPFE